MLTTSLNDIDQLITQSESTELEFKTSTAKLKSALESICAYLNSEGGVVLIGVNDNGNIVGQNVTDKTQLEIANLISKLEPAAQIKCEYTQIKDKRYVIKMIAYPNAELKPYVFDGKPYWRVLSSTRLMPQEKYQQLLMERTNKLSPWEINKASNVTLEDLDHNEIINTIKECIRRGRLEARYETEDPLIALRFLKLINNGCLINSAAVLFCKDPELHYSQCLLRMAKFQGTDKTNILDSKRIYGNAFTILKHAENFCLENMAIESKFIPGKMARNDIPQYPPRAVREAIVNAVCHRDYSIYGGSISIMLFSDRLEISNHGTLPFGITVDDLKHDHDSQPRNSRITQVLYRCGLIESIGAGTQEMIKECQSFNLPEPEYIERGNTFLVRFKCHSTKNNEYSAALKLSVRQHEVIEIISSYEKSSAKEILQSLSDQPKERTLRDDLAKLKELGLIATTGKGPGAVWFLTNNKAE